MRFRSALLAGTLVLALTTARGDDASKMAKVHEFFRLAKLNQLSAHAMDQVMTQMNSGAMQQIAGSKLTEDDQKRLDEFSGKVQATGESHHGLAGARTRVCEALCGCLHRTTTRRPDCVLQIPDRAGHGGKDTDADEGVHRYCSAKNAHADARVPESVEGILAAFTNQAAAIARPPLLCNRNIRISGLGARSNLFCLLRHLRCALDLVPIEGAAVDSALDGLEQHDRKDLPIGEALQPDVEEQPAVATVRRVLPFERESERRSDEIDDEEGRESRPAASRN